MTKIAFVTDSTTYIPKDLLGKRPLEVAPSAVIWGEEQYRDGVDIQPVEFYERLATAKEMPTTSQATPPYFQEIFEKLTKAGYTDIICYHVSIELSKTVQSANIAKEDFPKANIRVIDGQNASMGTGWPLLAGMKAADEGKSVDEIEKILLAARENAGVFFLPDTLEFLHRGGRIGGAQRFLGTALNLKPILEVQEGRVEPLERVRTKSKAMARMVELVGERTGGKTPLMLAVIHANAPDVAEELLEMVKERYKPEKAVITEVSPAVGTHTGPGTLGLCYMNGVDL